MSKIRLCEPATCSACKACINICPKGAISMETNVLGYMYPKIDNRKCIECNLCQKTCPSLNKVSFNKPLKVFAAWSTSDNDRYSSASGGIATALYKAMVTKKAFFSGVKFDSQFYAYQDLYNNLDELSDLKNSKYVYSDMRNIYNKIRKVLVNGSVVLFIGTPCQCAGVKNFIPESMQTNLFLVDLICHGMCPSEYLVEHIKSIENEKNTKAEHISFRDPDTYTYTYTFTLRNSKNKKFYQKKVLEDDVYQIGYHKKVIYNENCYNCIYARAERCTDMTIGDFSGLGNIEPVKYDIRNVSCVLVNTTKGNRLVQFLQEENKAFFDERPVDEALKFEQQLQRPSLPSVYRDKFLELYHSKGFEIAAKDALRKQILLNQIRSILKITEIRLLLSRLLPKNIKDIIRYLCKI